MYDEYVESALPAGNMNVEWTSNANPTGVGGSGGGRGRLFPPFCKDDFHTPHSIHIRPFLWLRLVEAFSTLVYIYIIKLQGPKRTKLGGGGSGEFFTDLDK